MVRGCVPPPLRRKEAKRSRSVTVLCSRTLGELYCDTSHCVRLNASDERCTPPQPSLCSCHLHVRGSLHSHVGLRGSALSWPTSVRRGGDRPFNQRPSGGPAMWFLGVFGTRSHSQREPNVKKKHLRAFSRALCEYPNIPAACDGCDVELSSDSLELCQLLLGFLSF